MKEAKMKMIKHMPKHIETPFEITEIMEMGKDDKLDSASVGKFIFSKTVIDLDLLKYDSIKELYNYINNEDAELNKIKILLKKANKKLRIDCRQLFIRKSTGRIVENIICITRR